MERLTAYDFFERRRYELVNGDLIDKAGQKTPRSFAVQSFYEVLVRTFGFGYVRGQPSLETTCKLTAGETSLNPSLQ